MGTKIPADHIRVERAYEPPTHDDGARILIDRLWPRGVKKEALALDQWAKQLSPSTEMRQWFSHDPARWQAFGQRHAAELHHHNDLLEPLRALARKGPITLVYSAQDEAHNNAVAMWEFLLTPQTIDAST